MTSRFFTVNYTLPGQIMQTMRVQASDVLAARKIVESMFANSKVIIGLVQEVR